MVPESMNLQNITPSRTAGRQVLKIPPVNVSLLSEDTHLSKLHYPQPGSTFYSATLGGNQVLRSLFISVLSSEASIRPVLKALALFDADPGGNVKELLAPIFPATNITFLQRQSRTPTLIGALINTSEAVILFYFGLHRGAARSRALPGEIRRCLLVEEFQRIMPAR